jgi:protein gp37
MNDLWADAVPLEFIQRILAHTRQYPENTYVFQTKNPERYLYPGFVFPPKCILGTTIETNRDVYGIGKAPITYYRMRAMEKVKARKFVTLEPIMEFDVKILAGWIDRIRPEFVNIGADSKCHGLPEPSFKKIMQLIKILNGIGIEVREKRNLERLKK